MVKGYAASILKTFLSLVIVTLADRVLACSILKKLLQVCVEKCTRKPMRVEALNLLYALRSKYEYTL